MTLPVSIDLRAQLDRVYHQGTTGACGPHSVVNALEAMHENLGTPKRFSRSWLYYWAQLYAGHVGSDLGTNFETLSRAVDENGLALEDEWPWEFLHQKPNADKGSLTGITLKRTLWNIDEVKRLLCLGVPVIFSFNCQQSFYDLRDQKDWRTHWWNSFGPVSSYDHYIVIVGYDDAAERFLCENSWGPEWGDGGFLGFPYSSFSVGAHAFHINRIQGFHAKAAVGYDTVPRYLTTTDTSEFTFGNRDNLKALLTSALASGGPQGLIDAAKKFGVTDKHLEYLMRKERGWVRGMQKEHPGLDWAGFHWVAIESPGLVYLMSSIDSAFFTNANQQNLIEMLTAALENGGPQSVIETAKQWAVSDKHIEHLFGWERGNVRLFQEANPALDWDGFPWGTL